MSLAKPQSPCIIEVGPVQFVLPDEALSLTRRTWADVSCAVILEADGLIEPARALVSVVESRLGVHDAHRRALETSPQQVAAEIGATARRRRAQLDQRAIRLAGEAREPAPTEEIERLIRRATEAEAKAKDLRAALGKRRPNRETGLAIKGHVEEAKRLRKTADALRRAQLDEHWASAAIAESANYALARREDVVEEQVVRARFETDDAGVRRRHRRSAAPAGIEFPGHRAGDAVLVEERVTRRRVLTRGGLELAYRRGDLDEGKGAKRERLLYATGQAYQQGYERIEGLAGGRRDPDGGSAVSTRRLDLPAGQEVVADQQGQFAAMRAALSPRQRAVLDRVCGLDMSIGAAAGAMGAGVPSIRRALRGGLGAAAQAAREWRERMFGVVGFERRGGR